MKAYLRPDAVVFARAGYLVVTFDYRGWGESDSRKAVSQGQPQDVREVVDPLDFGADWLNAIHWVAAEPQCDMTRLGLWGSSFAGGLVVFAAERDPRVKALHSQVPGIDGSWPGKTPAARRADPTPMTTTSNATCWTSYPRRRPRPSTSTYWPARSARTGWPS